jgi:peptidyl-prolyl cis-trans isomerase SurA
MKNILIIVIIFFSINLANARLAESIVAVVNNEIILLSELNEHIEKSNNFENSKIDKKEYLTELINLKVLEIQGKKMGIEIEEERVESIVKEIISKKGKDNYFKELESQKINEYIFKHRLKSQILQENLAQLVLKNKIVISEAEIEKYYERNFGKIEKENLINLYIFEPNDKSTIKKNTQVFIDNSNEIVLQNEIDKLIDNGFLNESSKHLGFINPDKLSAEISSKLINAEIDKLIGPIVYNGKEQFFIIKEIIVGDSAYLEAREGIETSLFQEKSIKLLDGWFQELRDNSYISIRL